jgi:MFS-type transporter involved in bile tolerance (Atg22 family)
LKKKPILYIVIMGASITRLLSVLFSTYLILWINHNIIIEGVDNIKESHEQQNLAKDIYINIMVTSALICIFVLPIIGKLCDTIDPRKIMPIAFLARCATTYMFWLLQ